MPYSLPRRSSLNLIGLASIKHPEEAQALLIDFEKGTMAAATSSSSRGNLDTTLLQGAEEDEEEGNQMVLLGALCTLLSGAPSRINSVVVATVPNKDILATPM